MLRRNNLHPDETRFRKNDDDLTCEHVSKNNIKVHSNVESGEIRNNLHPDETRFSTDVN